MLVRLVDLFQFVLKTSSGIEKPITQYATDKNHKIDIGCIKVTKLAIYNRKFNAVKSLYIRKCKNTMILDLGPTF